MDSLHLSCDSKTKFYSTHKNTFGLMYGLPEFGGTCPGATTRENGCFSCPAGRTRKLCYMDKITAIYKGAKQKLLENTELVVNKDTEALMPVLTATMEKFMKHSRSQDRKFRLHYSGDFFSRDYVQAWTRTIENFPSISFWGYTRSLNLIDPLVGIKNLVLFLSADQVNCEEVRARWRQLNSPNIGISYMGDVAPRDGLKWVVCPATSGKLKSEKAGACARCKLCWNKPKDPIKLRNIQFLIH